MSVKPKIIGPPILQPAKQGHFLMQGGKHKSIKEYFSKELLAAYLQEKLPITDGLSFCAYNLPFWFTGPGTVVGWQRHAE